jgi:hypothetical protein
MHLSLTKSTFVTPNLEILYLKKQLRIRNQIIGLNTQPKGKIVKDYTIKKGQVLIRIHSFSSTTNKFSFLNLKNCLDYCESFLKSHLSQNLTDKKFKLKELTTTKVLESLKSQNKNTGAGDHEIESIVYICCAKELAQQNYLTLLSKQALIQRTDNVHILHQFIKEKEVKKI